MKVKLLSITPFPEELIERCAREAYGTVDKMREGGDPEFIKKRKRVGHLSVFEHASATFLITGVSRIMTHELVRHRLASYTQRSGRYCDDSEVEFIIPPSFEKHDKVMRLYGLLGKMCLSFYKFAIKCGIPREDARYGFLFSHDTRITMTANFSEWLWIRKVRLDPHAHWEIREMIRQINNILAEYAPSTFEGVD